MIDKLFIGFFAFSISLFSTQCYATPADESDLLCIQCYESMPDCKTEFFSNGCKIVTDLEFLYWTAEVNAVDYALQTNNPVFSECGVGDFQNADYSYDPGFRVGLRYRNGPRYWEISAAYTWLNVSGKDSVEDTVNLITPTYLPDLLMTVTNGNSDIKLWYNILDVLAARVFDPNPHLRMRVSGGITGAWIEQNWKVTYSDTMNFVSTLNQKWTYRAVGYRVGAAFDWFWIWDIYLTGKASVGMTVGKYVNLSKQSSQFSMNPNLTFRDSRYEDYRIATHLQMLLGFSYQKLCQCVDYEIFAGYEFNAWNNLNEIFRCQGDSEFMNTLINNGLLGLHGLNVRLTVSF